VRSSQSRTPATQRPAVVRGATTLGTRTFDALLDLTWLVSYAALTGAGWGIERIREPGRGASPSPPSAGHHVLMRTHTQCRHHV
jgi:hypothetical protein